MHLPDDAPVQKNTFKYVCLVKYVCLAGLFLPAALLSASAVAETPPGSIRQTTSALTVEISGIKNASGEVCVSLFSGSAGFPNNEDSIVEKQCVKAVETNPSATLQSELQSGENAADNPASVLADIPGPVMENIIEGLTNNASDLDAEGPNAEALETNATTSLQEDVVITQAVLAITFTDIAPGTYAVSVLHDENEDGELNTGTFGIPTEGFGFSQNPEIRTGAPDFSEAATVVVGTQATTKVELIYY